MSQTTKIDIPFDSLVKFIETKLADVSNKEKQIANETEIVEIKIEKVQKSLKEVQEEIESNYRISIKAWRLSLKMYGDFIKKNPGSQMVNKPQNMPSRPIQVENIKSYIRMFDSFTTSTLKVKMAFLKEIFSLTSQALESSYTTRNYWTSATTGSALACLHSGEIIYNGTNTTMPLVNTYTN